MFYPVDSLRRGGRFYLCWIADSWPLRFATIEPELLCSENIPKICDDLLELMRNESGQATKRFSLRLSSQLLRGLVRLYERQTNIIIYNLYKINAFVTKSVNKKYMIRIDIRQETDLQIPHERFIPEELPEDRRVEELLENSSNVVRNVEDITLKEKAIPELQPQNDGFGEENPEQALQMLRDRPMEMMLKQQDPSASHSGLDIVLETTDKSQDRSRLVAPDAMMERISEHDVTIFGRASVSEAQLPVPDLEKDIPEIPEIPPPEVPAPQIQIQEKAIDVVPELPQVADQEQAKDLGEIVLEEIIAEPKTKKRRAQKLIIDKKIILESNFIRPRLQNVAVELRCEDSSDDIVEIRLPWEVYCTRPCHAGRHNYSNLSLKLTQLFRTRLHIVLDKIPLAERELQEAMAHRHHTLRPLETVVEVSTENMEQNIINTTAPRMSAHECTEPMEIDIADMQTQKLELIPQETTNGKRVSEEELPAPKKRRPGGVMHKPQRIPRVVLEDITLRLNSNKENIPENRKSEAENDIQAKDVRQMLQNIGLADGENLREIEQLSHGTETPLGSLDRTKVSLGESAQTTDSQNFLRDHWGTEGTMLKIFKMAKAKHFPINVTELVLKGPVIPNCERFIAARCFNSILKLKQSGFIIVVKDPITLEINHIKLGPKFERRP